MARAGRQAASRALIQAETSSAGVTALLRSTSGNASTPTHIVRCGFRLPTPKPRGCWGEGKTRPIGYQSNRSAAEGDFVHHEGDLQAGLTRSAVPLPSASFEFVYLNCCTARRGRKAQKIPLRVGRSSTRSMQRSLVGSNDLLRLYSIIAFHTARAECLHMSHEINAPKN